MIKPAKNILLVFPTLDWAKEERLLLRNALVYLSSGAKVTAVVIKDSFLHHRLKAVGVDLIFHKGGARAWWNWRIFNYLSDEIKKREINLVETVGQRFVWPLAHTLRGFNKTVFIVTLPPGAKFIKHTLDPIFYRRIDRLIATSLSMQNTLFLSTPISRQKIEYLPFGAFWNPLEERFPVGFDDKAPIIFATYLPVNESSVLPLLPLLYAFKALRTQYQSESFYLWIYSLKDWKKNFLHQELQNRLWELEIAETVKLKTEEMRGISFFDQIDIWLSPHIEDFDDLIISAISAGVPAVAPRCETLMTFLDRPELVAKSCKHGDARDLKVQMIDLIKNFNSYVEGANSFSQKMTGFMVYEDFKKSYLRLIETLIVTRDRKFKES